MDVGTQELPPSPSSAAVLIVDDERDVRAMLRLALEDEGYTVYEAEDGTSALERLRSHPFPMIVLLDWWMPGMDGLDVLHALAADAPEVQSHIFILVTSGTETLAARLSRNLADIPANLSVSVLGKPFDVDDILTSVARAAKRLAEEGKIPAVTSPAR